MCLKIIAMSFIEYSYFFTANAARTGSSSDIGMIVGIAVGALVLIVIVVVIVVWCNRKSDKSKIIFLPLCLCLVTQKSQRNKPSVLQSIQGVANRCHLLCFCYACNEEPLNFTRYVEMRDGIHSHC